MKQPPTPDEFEKFYDFLYPDADIKIKEETLDIYKGLHKNIAEQLKRAKDKEKDETK